MIVDSKFVRGVIILITALSGWSIGREFNSSFLVAGGSMEPTLHSGTMISCTRQIPDRIPRGTIVVVSRFPEPSSIKRVVGLPHETVTFHLGEVFVDARMLAEPYIPRDVTTYSWERATLTAGEDEYVVLGDNRRVSSDSRDYGPITRSQIIAIANIHSTTPILLAQPQFRIKTVHAQPAGPRFGGPAAGISGQKPRS
ncbi:MAG TPA: signal peptidase I [Verrucomicrobiae bacterium]|nr:signal peptidase I [Verrucomicrobiae bacterium]